MTLPFALSFTGALGVRRCALCLARTMRLLGSQHMGGTTGGLPGNLGVRGKLLPYPVTLGGRHVSRRMKQFMGNAQQGR